MNFTKTKLVIFATQTSGNKAIPFEVVPDEWIALKLFALWL